MVSSSGPRRAASSFLPAIPAPPGRAVPSRVPGLWDRPAGRCCRPSGLRAHRTRPLRACAVPFEAADRGPGTGHTHSFRSPEVLGGQEAPLPARISPRTPEPDAAPRRPVPSRLRTGAPELPRDRDPGLPSSWTRRCHGAQVIHAQSVSSPASRDTSEPAAPSAVCASATASQGRTEPRR